MSKSEKTPLLQTTSLSTDHKDTHTTATAGSTMSATTTTSAGTSQVETTTLISAAAPNKPSTEKKSSDEPKKKQAPVLHREVKITNPDEIDHMKLLLELRKRFQEKFLKWKKRTGVFKLANLIVTLLIISIQVAQVIVFQLPTHVLPTAQKTAIATILPSVTSAVLAIQLKLGWSEKSTKCKRAAAMYNKLASHAEYRIDMLECGGKFHDTTKIWNTALVSEASEIPSFLSAY
uniref:uncharacterized protein LOC100179168 isoform X2 n=1 Tax=Ciona intestinalis TaxID=7719 RepID=UPI000EF50326|nr:uncharacterized protein LOC100179168 isoform X2 [Ciona intestinalis]|eukprot:XP_026696394.1 uncharacterized protein LOC100179168 isoform X2 [Ciona intestinalis]